MSMPTATPQVKRRRRWPWVVVVAIAVVIIAVSCSHGSSSTTGPGAVPQAATSSAASDQVTYEVTGADGASQATSITYGANGTMSQANGKALPWKASVPASSFGFYSLSAQSGTGSDGSITCTISEGGKVVQTNTSSGPYAVVMCNGS